MSREKRRTELRPIGERREGSNEPRFRLMDLDAPRGAYGIDAFADYFMGAPVGDPIQVRWAVERAGRVAHIRAERELDIGPEHRKLTLRLLDALDPIARLIPSLGPEDDDLLTAARIAEVFESRPDQPIAAMVGQLLNACRQVVRAEEHLIASSRLRTSGPPNSDPLVREYVALMWKHFEIATGKSPPSGRSGQFVDLLAAGWQDLNLPERPDLDFGQRVEAHARSLRSLEAK